jgi:hypothetical protein
MTAFNGLAMSAFVNAFEQAWDEFVETHAPVSADMYRFREILARRILALADQREPDGSRLPSHGSYQASTETTPEGRLINETA